MSLSFKFCPFISSPKSNRRFTLLKPRLQSRTFSSASKFCYLPKIVCAQGSSDQLPVSATKPRWENWLSTAASLYPVYVTVGGVVACLRPSTFAWFVNRGPISYGLSLGFIMLAMGLTLELKDFLSLFMRRPFSEGQPPMWYITAALGGFSEPQRRAISVEVGMQNSSLGVVLATTHFTSPMVSLPPAMSAVIMNIMGSTLAFFWKYMDASDSKMNPETDEKRG